MFVTLRTLCYCFLCLLPTYSSGCSSNQNNSGRPNISNTISLHCLAWLSLHLVLQTADRHVGDQSRPPAGYQDKVGGGIRIISTCYCPAEGSTSHNPTAAQEPTYDERTNIIMFVGTLDNLTSSRLPMTWIQLGSNLQILRVTISMAWTPPTTVHNGKPPGLSVYCLVEKPSEGFFDFVIMVSTHKEIV